jgi:hypothetical protein
VCRRLCKILGGTNLEELESVGEVFAASHSLDVVPCNDQTPSHLFSHCCQLLVVGVAQLDGGRIHLQILKHERE